MSEKGREDFLKFMESKPIERDMQIKLDVIEFVNTFGDFRCFKESRRKGTLLTNKSDPPKNNQEQPKMRGFPKQQDPVKWIRPKGS